MARLATVKSDPDQQELIEAAHIKFSGMSAAALATPPEIDEVQTYTVRAVCTGVGYQRRKDGELRHTRQMEVLDIAFGDIEAPPESPQLAIPVDIDDD